MSKSDAKYSFLRHFKMREAGQMKKAQQIPELSEERAAQILKNVFAACGVPENKTPFHELQLKYQKMSDGVKDGER